MVFTLICVRLTGLSQLRHGKIPFSHMEGVPTLCPEIPIYTPGRFVFPFLILFLAYIGACADWRGSPALSKALEAVGGKGLGWVCSAPHRPAAAPTPFVRSLLPFVLRTANRSESRA